VSRETLVPDESTSEVREAPVPQVQEMSGADCWDQIVEGYSIPNTGKSAEVGQRELDDEYYGSVSDTWWKQ
jgi:hypothetical protein